jgi:hypothetical protein
MLLLMMRAAGTTPYPAPIPRKAQSDSACAVHPKALRGHASEFLVASFPKRVSQETVQRTKAMFVGFRVARNP